MTESPQFKLTESLSPTLRTQSIQSLPRPRLSLAPAKLENQRHYSLPKPPAQTVFGSSSCSVAPSSQFDVTLPKPKLEIENKAFQKEVEELRLKLANVSATSGVENSAQKVRESYLQKLTFLEDQVTVLTRKLDTQSQLSTQRRRGDESAKPFQFEI